MLRAVIKFNMSVWNRQTWRWLACLSISTTYVYYRKSKAATNLGRRPFQYAIIKIPLKLAKLNYFFKFKKKNYVLIVVMGGSWTLKQTEKRLMNYTWNFNQTYNNKTNKRSFLRLFLSSKGWNENYRVGSLKLQRIWEGDCFNMRL
jgi:hypothetical protein